MDPFTRQRGYTRITKLILLVLVAGVGYLGAAFWEPATSYYRVRTDSRRMANRILTQHGDPEHHIRRFIEETYHTSGLNLTRPDVYVDRSESMVKVSVHLTIPYEFPFTDEIRFWRATVDVTAERMRGF